MAVAGLVFAPVTEADGFWEMPAAAYRRFQTPTSTEVGGSEELPVSVSAGAAPIVPEGPVVFDSGGAWKMYREGGERIVVMGPGEASEPLWTARMPPDFSSAAVQCAEFMVRVEGRRRLLFNPVCYPLDQILLVHRMCRHGGALLHAAGALYDGKAFVFAGVSGAGKSTLSRSLANRSGWHPLSDDRILVRLLGGRFFAFGTPWAGEAGIADPAGAPLESVFFLHHGTASRISPLSTKAALQSLLPVVSIPWYDREAVEGIFGVLEALLTEVPAYDLFFQPNSRVVSALEDVATQ